MLRPTRGHLGLAGDLVALAEHLEGARDALGSRVGVDSATLDRAGSLGQELLRAVADRGTGDSATGAFWTLQTARAFTLVARAYDSARRAVSYLRWPDADLGTPLPSLRSTAHR